jgi:hypothetical protein
MTAYVKSTNFASKDSLASGNPLKIVKGTEFDIEFNNIATAIDSKADTNSPAFAGIPLAPTAAYGNNTTQVATTAFVTAAMQAVYPVGSVYINAGSTTNPSTLLGFGTWAAFGAGRVMVGLNGSDSLFDSLEETGGSKDAVVVSHSHTGTTSSNTHSHYVSSTGNADGGSYLGNYNPSNFDNFKPSIAGTTIVANDKISSSNTHDHSFTTNATGSSGTNANLQPYITVAMWKRTA